MSITKEKVIKSPIPAKITSEGVLLAINKGIVKSTHLNIFKDFVDLSDETLSRSLNMNVKTYRTYKTKVTSISADKQEHIIMLLSLLQHGKEIFGSSKEFSNWLTTKNFQLGKSPIEYLNTISGIKLIDDRLTGIEYGDNA